MIALYQALCLIVLITNCKSISQSVLRLQFWIHCLNKSPPRKMPLSRSMSAQVLFVTSLLFKEYIAFQGNFPLPVTQRWTSVSSKSFPTCAATTLPASPTPCTSFPSSIHLYSVTSTLVPAVLFKLWLKGINNSNSLLVPSLPASPLSPVNLDYLVSQPASLLCAFVGVSVFKPPCYVGCLCWSQFYAGNAVEWENEDKQHHSDAGLCHM